jgi:uncharacterized MnhB-related membrane protein
MSPAKFRMAGRLPLPIIGEAVMTNISTHIPEQTSRFNSAIISGFGGALIVLAGFLLLAAPFALA